MGSYFFLNITFACYHREMTVEQEISKMVNSVVLPVVNAIAKVFQCFVS
jgi:hypothetical protein